MTKILIVGAPGRMGQAIARLCVPENGYQLIAEVGRQGNVADRIADCDAIIEFSHHTVSGSVTDVAAAHGKALVIGTTGHTPEERQHIKAGATRIPIVLAPNFSIGVNLLFHLTQKVAQILGDTYDQEIVEMHHRLKLDTPSGTAKRLGEILAEVKKQPYANVIKDGRSGETGKRTPTEIGMHAVRGGDVVGDHTVYFAGIGERIELTHRASSRETFASGALRAAAWATRQKPGFYSMQNVLGLT